MKSRRTLSRATSSKTVRSVRRVTTAITKSIFVDKEKLTKYLEKLTEHWYRISASYLSPQGIATVESRVAAGKAFVLKQVIDSILDEDYLEVWDDD